MPRSDPISVDPFSDVTSPSGSDVCLRWRSNLSKPWTGLKLSLSLRRNPSLHRQHCKEYWFFFLQSSSSLLFVSPSGNFFVCTTTFSGGEAAVDRSLLVKLDLEKEFKHTINSSPTVYS